MPRIKNKDAVSKQRQGRGTYVSKPTHTLAEVKKANKFISKVATIAPSEIKANVDYLAPPYYHPELAPSQLLLPKTRRERNVWCRSFYENDPIVAAAIDIHTEIPLSKIRLTLPETSDHDLARYVLGFYEEMCEKIKLFQVLLDISFEYNLLGNCFPFAEYNEEKRMWDRIIILDPDYVEINSYPFSDLMRVELQIPEDVRSMILSPMTADDRRIVDSMPEDVVDYVKAGRNIPLSTDPYEGSHVDHIARKRSPYRGLGTSIIERLFKILVYKDRLRNAQDAIAERHMTPRNLIIAENTNEAMMEELRQQIEISFEDPDFAMICNYPVTWEIIGSQERLLSIRDEFEFIEGEMMAGLGVTRALLTGEESYGGAHVALDLITQRYLLFREQIQSYVENKLFKPIAWFNGFVENVDGRERLIYPKLAFNRISLRDNEEVFANLFNLYSKGSLDVSTILELYNIDAVEVRKRLEKDLFTINDSTFNELVRQLYTEVSGPLVQGTDFAQKLGGYLNFKFKDGEEGGEDEERFG